MCFLVSFSYLRETGAAHIRSYSSLSRARAQAHITRKSHPGTCISGGCRAWPCSIAASMTASTAWGLASMTSSSTRDTVLRVKRRKGIQGEESYTSLAWLVRNPLTAAVGRKQRFNALQTTMI